MGSGVWPIAMTTRSSKPEDQRTENRSNLTSVFWPLISVWHVVLRCVVVLFLPFGSCRWAERVSEDRDQRSEIRLDLFSVLFHLFSGMDQADRAISTGKLHALLRFHTRPIDVVVYHGSHARPGFEGGFPLRCLQRLSRPRLATRRCGWRHNRSTRGASIPVLSY